MTRIQNDAQCDNVGSSWALLVMGPSGCGKSTIGQRLATTLGVSFIDADRLPWLTTLAGLIHSPHQGLVLACSALKEQYRTLLQAGPTSLHVVYLQASESELQRRLISRTGHFAGADLLASQLAALEPPPPHQCYDAEMNEEELCQSILTRLGHLPPPAPFLAWEAQ